jgi:hypothetical protein
MAIGVVYLFEIVDVHQEEGEGMVFQSLPRNFVLEVVQQEAPVVDTGEFILKDEPGWIFAHMLKKLEEFFVFHFRDRRPWRILMLPYLFSFKQLGFQIFWLSPLILEGGAFFQNDECRILTTTHFLGFLHILYQIASTI